MKDMNAKWFVVILLILVLAIVWPFIGSEYEAYLALSFFAYSIALFGLNLLFNYTGLLSFGQGMFIALGAYTTAFLTSKFNIKYIEVSILASIVICGGVGTIIGFICARYVKIYFAMLTFAFSMLFHSFLMKTYKLTGAEEGMPVIQPLLLGIDFTSLPAMEFFTRRLYYYILFILIVAALLMWRIVHSHFGLCLQAVRDNPEKAKHLGIDIRRYRLYAFIIAGCFAGVAGVLLAVVMGHVDPVLAYLAHSGDLVMMMLIGGFTNFFGPMLGSLIFVYLHDIITSFSEYWRFIFGALLCVIVIMAPGGVIEVFGRVIRWLGNKMGGKWRALRAMTR